LAEAQMTVQAQLAVIATLRADNERERREGQEALAVVEQQRQQDAAQFAVERDIRLADIHRLEREEREGQEALAVVEQQRQQDAAQFAVERDIRLADIHRLEREEREVRDQFEGFRAEANAALEQRDILLVQARKRWLDDEQTARDELEAFRNNIEQALSERDISLVRARKQQIDDEQVVRDELNAFKNNIEETLGERDISLVRARKQQIDDEQVVRDELNAFKNNIEETLGERDISLVRARKQQIDLQGTLDYTRTIIADLQSTYDRAQQAILDAEAESVRQVRALAEAKAQADLKNHSLQRQISEQSEALALLEQRQAQIAAAYSAIATSTTWRVTAPVRQWLARHPGLSTRTRQVLKLIYWTVSLKLPERLKQRRQFMNAQAAERVRLSSVSVGQESLEPTTHHAPPPPAPKRPFPWPIADAPNTPREIVSAYDLRTDDSVPPEAERGRQFIERFDLLGASPRFSDAVAFLNARSRPALVGPDGTGPDVSIIIPVYGQLAYTLNCLDALIGHETRYRFEILIGDDGSPDDSGLHLPNLLDVTHVRHSQNKGFIRNCNSVAERARGHYVVMLNNDVRVVACWLDELIGSFALFPKAGLVGSKLFYPDGSLQEAGGIIWQDGSAWNYGRDDDPNRSQYSYARQVDYVSGASIAVPTDLWHSLGGFDEAYVPAYCEDSDLAFRIRDAGHEVWMQPLSRVLHYEGKTSGTDLGSGAKAYQVINQERLKDRWALVLADHRQNGVAPEFERERKVSKRVLVIDATAPTPDQDAGSVTTVKVMEVFQALDYKVTYVPLDNWLYQPRYIDPLQRRGIECVYAPFHHRLDAYLKENGHLFDVVHVFRFNVMQDAISAIKKHCPQAQIVFNNMDLHYLRVERQASVENSDILRATAKSLKTTELAVMEKANVVCVPSTVEKALLEAETKLTKPVAVMPFMIDLPDRASGFGPPRRDILFLGGYGHSPNIDAAVWMAQEIWPLIRHRMVGSRLVLAGANPTPEVLGLAAGDILVPGRVDDLGPLFASASVFVAPLRYGAGVKGKIYSAFGAGVPVVSTAIGVEGMNLTEGVHALIADEPAAFADAVLALASDQQRWSDIADAGWTFVRDHHGIAAGCDAMRPLLNLE
jgi:GT2 family glycosyltransferase